MTRLARTLVITGLLALAAPALAQDGWSDLAVPVGALRVLQIDPSQGRSLALNRAIHVLHPTEWEDVQGPPLIRELDSFLLTLDKVEEALARLPPRGITLEMAKTSTERRALQSVLDSVGLRLRERRGAYTVEQNAGGGTAALRATLLSSGIDTAAIAKQLNAGETVTIAPTVAAFPLPAPHEIWNETIFGRQVPARALFGAILRDRRASLLYVGLSMMTPDTRAYLVNDADLLQRFYRDAAGPLAAFGASFVVDRRGQVVVPGGPAAAPLWQTLLDEDVSEPSRFGRTLFDRDGGRLAYFYDTVARLDEAHQRFALGLWVADPTRRLERFRALYRTFVDVEPQWSPLVVPFTRPLYDPAVLLSVVSVTQEGRPAAPAYRKLWERALDGTDIPDVDARELQDVAADGLVDAAWLAERLTGLLSPDRRAQLERIAFGQRTFESAPVENLQEVLVALRAFGRFPALMLTLERMGVRQPAIFASSARHALLIERLADPAASMPLLAQFQGALALLDRLSRTNAIDADRAAQLVSSLAGLQIADEKYAGRVGAWVEQQLLPALREASSVGARTKEARLLDALTDIADIGAPFEWEGERYVVDVKLASRANLEAVRAKQGGNSLDAVLELLAHARTLTAEQLTLDQIKAAARMLRADASKLVPARPWTGRPEDVPDMKRVVDRAARDLERIDRDRDTPRAARIAEPVVDVADYLLGETLVALAYAPLLGDAADLLTVDADPSHRHNFGLVTRVGAADANRKVPWQRPRQDPEAIGQAVTGSLLGLDLAMSAKRLRRLAADRVPSTPRLNANYRNAFVDTLALLNPRLLMDDVLQTLGASVRRGRDLLSRAAAEPEALDQLAQRVQMSPSRRQVLSWVVRRDSSHVVSLFSPAELFWLGSGPADTAAYRPWGVSSEPMTGCFCLRFPERGEWELFGGRAGSSQLSTAIPDLTIRVAELLAERQIPAPLFPEVLSMAMQDYIDSVPAAFDDDWEAIAGQAAKVARERVEDYVSALVTRGSLRPAAGDGGGR